MSDYEGLAQNFGEMATVRKSPEERKILFETFKTEDIQTLLARILLQLYDANYHLNEIHDCISYISSNQLPAQWSSHRSVIIER